jgi:hypothetical protein
MMIAVSMSLTSCLKNDSDDAETVSYNETAITSFSLTAVNRYIHTTSKAGADSVYKKALTVKNYPFSIDHYQRKIYNTDSLPADCDLKHVLVTIGKSTYSGDIFFKSVVGDTLRIYSSTDSVDLSQAREVQVYNSSRERHRSYTVQVNVKKDTTTGIFSWQQMDSNAQGVPAGIRNDAKVADATETGFRLTTDGGATWSQETLNAEESAALLPTGVVGYISFPLDPLNKTMYHLIAGPFKDNDYMCSVWRKVTVDGKGSWSCILNLPLPTDKKYLGHLPSADHISMAFSDETIYAILDNGKIYKSKDQGLSWQTDSTLNLPNGATDHLRAATDEEGYIWLLKEDSGTLWRGYINW